MELRGKSSSVLLYGVGVLHFYINDSQSVRDSYDLLKANMLLW